MGHLMDSILSILTSLGDQVVRVLRFPIEPGNRIFWLYLLSSACVAFLVYRRIKAQKEHVTARDAEAAQGSFVQFLFPKSVWSHPSAWLDLRYLFFHKIMTGAILASLGFAASVVGYRLASGGSALELLFQSQHDGSLGNWALAICFMVVSMLVLDFIGFFLHFLQHKIPLLWQFHKVHHSAEVMHPVSNFREHPIDNITYVGFISLGYGLLYGLAVRWIGFMPTAPTLLGVPLLMFLFNVVGYNLRHSHVWLRWPGVWSAVFPSPAHHHVHHSCHPDHIDKNFAFMFPVWDVLFGTYTMPEDNRDVKFGVPEEQGRDLDSVWRLYWVPFRDAYRLYVKPKSKPETEVEQQVPAE